MTPSPDSAHRHLSSQPQSGGHTPRAGCHMSRACPGAQSLGPLRRRSQAESERRKPRGRSSYSRASVSRNSSQRHDFWPPSRTSQPSDKAAGQHEHKARIRSHPDASVSSAKLETPARGRGAGAQTIPLLYQAGTHLFARDSFSVGAQRRSRGDRGRRGDHAAHLRLPRFMRMYRSADHSRSGVSPGRIPRRTPRRTSGSPECWSAQPPRRAADEQAGRVAVHECLSCSLALAC
jgi:hypothetical protein